MNARQALCNCFASKRCACMHASHPGKICIELLQYSFLSDCRNVYWLSTLAFCPRNQDPQTTRNHSQERQVRADTVRSKRFLTWQSTLETSLTVILLQSRCSHQSCKRPTWDRMARTRGNCVIVWVQSYYTTLYHFINISLLHRTSWHFWSFLHSGVPMAVLTTDTWFSFLVFLFVCFSFGFCFVVERACLLWPFVRLFGDGSTQSSSHIKLDIKPCRARAIRGHTSNAETPNRAWYLWLTCSNWCSSWILSGSDFKIFKSPNKVKYALFPKTQSW